MYKFTLLSYLLVKILYPSIISPLISPLNQSGELLKDPRELSQEFNNFFGPVFTDEDLSDVPQATNVSSLVSEINSIEITEDRVRKCMTKLRADKSPGSDDISPRLLIPITEEIVVPLTIIFNKLLESGSVPEDWRTANVCPIYKKGKRTSPELSTSKFDQSNMQTV